MKQLATLALILISISSFGQADLNGRIPLRQIYPIDTVNIQSSQWQTYIQGLILSNAQVLYSNGSPGNISISDGNSLTINVFDGDSLSTNEIQTLSVSNDTIFLSDGGNVKVPTPSYSLTSNYVPYWNGTTFTDSPILKNGDEIEINRTTTGYALNVNNTYSSTGGSYGLYINTLGSDEDNIGLNVDGSFLVYGNGRVRYFNYGSTSTFTGTVENYLAVDANGNMIIASGTSGSGDDWGSQVALTSGFIDGTGVTGDPIVLSATGTPSSSTFLRGDGTWAVPAAGSGYWNSSTSGIYYNSGNVSVGRTAALSTSQFDAYTTDGSEYAGTFVNTSTSGQGLYISQAGSLRPYLSMETEFAFLTGAVLAWGDGSTPSTPSTGNNFMYVDNGVPYWKDDNGTATSMIQGGAGYTLPTATDAVLGGVKTSSTGGTQMSGDFITQSDIRLNTATPLTSDYIGFWDVSGNAQRKMTLSTLQSLIGGSGTTDLSFTGTSSPVTLNSSSGTDVTFTAGTDIALSANGTNLTISYDGTSGGDGYVSSLAFNTGTGVLTANDPVNGAKTVDLDGRYVELAGDVMTGSLEVANLLTVDGTSSGLLLQVNNTTEFQITASGTETGIASVSNPLEFDVGGTNMMTLNTDGSVSLNQYAGTSQTGTPTYVLGTDANGKIVKTSTTGTPWTDEGSNLTPTNDETVTVTKLLVNNGASKTTEVWESGIKMASLSNSTASYSGYGYFWSRLADNVPMWTNTTNTYLIDLTATSDFWKKKDFRPIHNALDKVLKLNTYAFNWKEDAPEFAPADGISIEIKDDNRSRDATGVIAQEIEDIMPEVVKDVQNGYKAVDYKAIVPYLIEAIKEQQKQINELKNQINKL